MEPEPTPLVDPSVTQVGDPLTLHAQPSAVVMVSSNVPPVLENVSELGETVKVHVLMLDCVTETD
jgi:hypothetical protein